MFRCEHVDGSGGDEVGEEGSYLLELQLGPLADVGVGIESCDDATSNCSGIHLDDTTQASACSRSVGWQCLKEDWGRDD